MEWYGLEWEEKKTMLLIREVASNLAALAKAVPSFSTKKSKFLFIAL